MLLYVKIIASMELNVEESNVQTGVYSIFTGVKVAVIDDSKTIRKSADRILQKAGCEVVLSEDGYQAMSDIYDFEPDIIFIDVMMPKLDGYQTCTLIRRNKKFEGVKIIMLSSKDGLFDKAKGVMSGSNEYLTKPFSGEDILDAIKRNLELG